MRYAILGLGFLGVLAAQQVPPQAGDTYAAAAALLRSDAPPTVVTFKRVSRKADAEDVVRFQRELPLPASALTALSMAQQVLTIDPQPHQASDGTVMFTFGRGIPVVVCALLRMTEINLEPGELIEKDGIDIADGDFKVAVRKAGSGPDTFAYIALKPTKENAETTMTIGTDRRVYYLRLRSTGTQYMSRVGFSYPDEEIAKNKAAEKEAEDRRRAEKESEDKLAALASPNAVKSWDYKTSMHGRDARYMVPLSVGDDGVHTHIQFSQQVRVRGLPVLQIKDASGPIPANYHWEENRLIVDAIFEDGCLLQGVGRKQQRVCIHNNALPGKKEDVANVN